MRQKSKKKLQVLNRRPCMAKTPPQEVVFFLCGNMDNSDLLWCSFTFSVCFFSSNNFYMIQLTICKLNILIIVVTWFSFTVISVSLTKDHFSARSFRLSANTIVFARPQAVQISMQVISWCFILEEFQLLNLMMTDY